MDLLKTILVYMTIVYVSSVQSAPEPTIAPTPTETPVAMVETVETAEMPTLAPTPTFTPVPTPDITPNTSYKNLKVGDKGKNVIALQTRLKELGYYEGELDGGFGGQTRRAVERFQYNNGLDVDGIAGKRTQTVLYEYDKVVYAPAVTLAPTDLPASPTPSATLAPTNTPAPTETPIPTFAPTQTPDPTAPPLVSEDLTVENDVELWLSGGTQAIADADGNPLRPALGKDGQSELVPLIQILEAANVMIVPSVSGDVYEYAFMLDEENVFYLAYRQGADGSVTDLTLDLNRGELTAVPQAVMIAQTLYIPTTSLTDVLKIGVQKTTGRLTLTLPASAQP